MVVYNLRDGCRDNRPWCAQGPFRVLLTMTDDHCYGVSSTFGGIITLDPVDRKAGLQPHH